MEKIGLLQKVYPNMNNQIFEEITKLFYSYGTNNPLFSCEILYLKVF